MTTGTRALVVILVALTSRAHAEKSEAKELFEEGRRLLQAGKIEKACEKLEASEKLEARDSTELNLADCWEQLGRTASAWSMFVKLAGTSKREDRATEARRRAKELENKLVHLTIEVPADAELDDLVITRNEQVVDRAQWNQEVPVDPDEYTISAKAADHEEWSTTIKVKTKDKRVEVPKLERAKGKKRAPKPEPVAANRYRGLAIGLAVGGAGAILIGTGVALHSKGLQNDSDALCPDPTCGDLRGVDLNRRARQEGWIANITWGLGGAAVVAAIVTWSIGGKQKTDAVAVSPVITGDHAGLALGGRF